MDWGFLAGQRWATEGAVASLTRGVVINCGSPANTEGSWTEIVASTAFSADGLLLNFTRTAAMDSLLDIAIGASSEAIIIPDLLLSNGGSNGWFAESVFVPIAVPANTRLSARAQGTSAATSCHLTIMEVALGFEASRYLQRVVNYGTNDADSGGTQVDPGGSLNTKGAWSQLTAATTANHKGLLIALGMQTRSWVSVSALLDIGIGPATETVLIPNIEIGTSSTVDTFLPQIMGPFWVDIPSGTRLTARAQKNYASAGGREFDVAVYGIG